jgi:two-component system NtrC family sensor kinase
MTKEKSAAYAEAIPVPFGMLDGNGRVTDWNSRLEMLTGFSLDDINGRPLADLTPQLAAGVEEIMAGREIAVLPLAEARSGDPGQKADSKAAGALMIKLKALFSCEGEVEGIAVLVSCEHKVFHGYDDIFNFLQSLSDDELLYEQIAERIEERQQKMLQSEKLAGIGHLAAGVAHEINNPVGYVCSNLNALKDYVADIVYIMDSLEQLQDMISDNDELVTFIKKVKQRADVALLRDDLLSVVTESIDGVERVKQIVQSLKNFSHIDDNQFVDYDLVEGLEATLRVANNEIKYKADVDRQLKPVGRIQCLPSQINQVMLNLLVNAAQAMDEKGTITLRTGEERDGVWFEIEDTGCGIEEKDVRRLFEPFFTTKPVGQGTGLGLSLSYSIVKKHHGEITVQSRPGEGTTFHIWLPRTQSPQRKIA